MLALSEATNASLVIAIGSLGWWRLGRTTGEPPAATLAIRMPRWRREVRPLHDLVGNRWGQGRPVRSAAPVGSSWQGGSLPKPQRATRRYGRTRPALPRHHTQSFRDNWAKLGLAGGPVEKPAPPLLFVARAALFRLPLRAPQQSGLTFEDP